MPTAATLTAPPATPQFAPGPTSAPSGFTISGTVYEATATGTRPLAGFPLDISVESQSHPPQTTTDAQGRYSVTRSGPGPYTVKNAQSGYSQPCVARTATQTDTVLNVYVVGETVLRETGLPASFPVANPTVSGVVFEQIENVNRAVPNPRITADYSGGLGWGPAATTIGDAGGRYVLCGVEPAWITILASDGKRLGSAVLEPGMASVDIEMPRR
jgi:hypothetical protein